MTGNTVLPYSGLSRLLSIVNPVCFFGWVYWGEKPDHPGTLRRRNIDDIPAVEMIEVCFFIKSNLILKVNSEAYNPGVWGGTDLLNVNIHCQTIAPVFPRLTTHSDVSLYYWLL